MLDYDFVYLVYDILSIYNFLGYLGIIDYAKVVIVEF